MLRDDAEELQQRFGVGVQVDEDETGPGIAVHRSQRTLRRVDALRESVLIERAGQRAVDVVLPAVEQAGEELDMAAARLA